MQTRPFCYVDNKEMQAIGLKNLGYESWDTLWADYTVFTMVRNPYDRAGSSFDYILGRHEVRCSCFLQRSRSRATRTTALAARLATSSAATRCAVGWLQCLVCATVHACRTLRRSQLRGHNHFFCAFFI